jgi:hypothetical protein
MNTAPVALRSRRSFLGTAAAGVVGAAVLPRTSSSAEATPPPAKPRNAFAYRFAIGDLEAWSISDGHMVFKEGLNLMWPEADRGAMRDDLMEHGERTDGLPLYVNILVVKSAKSRSSTRALAGGEIRRSDGCAMRSRRSASRRKR